MSEAAQGVRLQKVLAAGRHRVPAGLRSADQRGSGRGERPKSWCEQGRRVDPERDVIRVDGSRIPPPRRHLYLVLNKPRGVVSRWMIPRAVARSPT